jgi:tyrosine-specific transport protein
MVPSLSPLLGYNRKKLWIACIIGTLIPFLVYMVWQWVILGAVPLEGKNGLLEAYLSGEPATYSLGALGHNSFLTIATDFFTFFALITPFLGLTMGLFDFLADGCHIQKNKKGRILLTSLVLVPSLIAALYFDRIFLTALDFSGGFGDPLLNGFLPILMIWSGASLYLKKKKSEKALLYSGLLLLGLIFAAALGCELYSQITSGNTIYDTKVVDIIEMGRN